MKYRFTLKIILTILFFILADKTTACTCSHIEKTFFENINKESIILKVEILGREKLPGEILMDFRSFTKLKILDSIKGKINSDTIYMINGTSGSCIESIEKIPVGEVIVIKVFKNSFKEQKEIYQVLNQYREIDREKINKYFAKKDKVPLVQAVTCSKWLLHLRNGRIYGDIMCKKERTRLNIFKRKKNSKKVDIVEEMNYTKFVKKLKRIEERK